MVTVRVEKKNLFMTGENGKLQEQEVGSTIKVNNFDSVKSKCSLVASTPKPKSKPKVENKAQPSAEPKA